MNILEQLEALGGEVCGGVCFVNRHVAGEFINEQFVLSPFGKTLIAEAPKPAKRAKKSEPVVESANALVDDLDLGD